MEERDDRDLVRECLAGRTAAFEALIVRYQKPIYNTVLRMVKDPDEAADLTQSVFLKAYEKLSTFDPRFKFFSWLYRIAVNATLNSISHRKRQERLDEETAVGATSFEEELDEAERCRKLEEAILRLRAEHRIVIVLRYFQNLSYGEIGQILELPEKTVKSRLFTARQLLKDILLRWGLQE
jgi:RNA polymerase sigma-70 factor (ECF subfamily)